MLPCSCDKKIFNVIVLGFAFMLIFTAFQTCGGIQTLVITGIKSEDPSYSGSGYTSLAVIYAALAVGNWFVPSALTYTGSKLAMLVGGITYCIFISNFLYPVTWVLYLVSVIIGLGAALIWTGQGLFLTINSDSETMARNAGIFWAMLQCSLLFGNLFVYFEFEGEDVIHKSKRNIVFGVLLALGVLGTLLLLVLRGGGRNENAVEQAVPDSPVAALVKSFNLFKTVDMILLSLTFFYTGLELSFFSGVYGTCLGQTKAFGGDSSKYAGVSGMLIGCGEILGGAVFGILGKKTNQYGRDPIVILGYVVHMISFFLIFINLPEDSPLNATYKATYITPSIPIALACSFLLGFADSCFNTQIYSILGSVYSDNSAPAFAVFKFVQSVAAAVAFFYSSAFTLYIQLLIMVITGTIGSLSFCVVEWKAFRNATSNSPAPQEEKM